MNILWHELVIFKGIDLNDSFVQSWKQGQTKEGEFILFKLLASIWPESPFYETPKPEEYTCYKPAVLHFRHCKSIVGLQPITSVRSTLDPDGTIDYGNIDALSVTENGYDVVGDFRRVSISWWKIRLCFSINNIAVFTLHSPTKLIMQHMCLLKPLCRKT